MAVDKQTQGRKRPSVGDVLGRRLTVVVPSAGSPEGTGGKRVLPQLLTELNRNVPKRWCRLNLSWAAGA